LGAAGVALGARKPPLDPRRVVVAGFEDLSGNPALAPFAHLSAHWVTEGLTRGGLVDVAPAAITEHLDAAGIRALAEASGARTVVLGSYYGDGDSVRFQIQIVDAEQGILRRALPPVSAPSGAPQLAADAIRRGVAAAVDTLFGRQLNNQNP
ncbi:MAG: hypothetical protein ACREMN_14285, partial [Gemmatimonadales bacterium]